jgi:hypothetical protein
MAESTKLTIFEPLDEYFQVICNITKDTPILTEQNWGKNSILQKVIEVLSQNICDGTGKDKIEQNELKNQEEEKKKKEEEEVEEYEDDFEEEEQKGGDGDDDDEQYKLSENFVKALKSFVDNLKKTDNPIGRTTIKDKLEDIFLKRITNKEVNKETIENLTDDLRKEGVDGDVDGDVDNMINMLLQQLTRTIKQNNEKEMTQEEFATTFFYNWLNSTYKTYEDNYIFFQNELYNNLLNVNLDSCQLKILQEFFEIKIVMQDEDEKTKSVDTMDIKKWRDIKENVRPVGAKYRLNLKVIKHDGKLIPAINILFPPIARDIFNKYFLDRRPGHEPNTIWKKWEIDACDNAVNIALNRARAKTGVVYNLQEGYDQDETDLKNKCYEKIGSWLKGLGAIDSKGNVILKSINYKKVKDFIEANKISKFGIKEEEIWKCLKLYGIFPKKGPYNKPDYDQDISDIFEPTGTTTPTTVDSKFRFTPDMLQPIFELVKKQFELSLADGEVYEDPVDNEPYYNEKGERVQWSDLEREIKKNPNQWYYDSQLKSLMKRNANGKYEEYTPIELVKDIQKFQPKDGEDYSCGGLCIFDDKDQCQEFFMKIIDGGDEYTVKQIKEIIQSPNFVNSYGNLKENIVNVNPALVLATLKIFGFKKVKDPRKPDVVRVESFANWWKRTNQSLKPLADKLTNPYTPTPVVATGGEGDYPGSHHQEGLEPNPPANLELFFKALIAFINNNSFVLNPKTKSYMNNVPTRGVDTSPDDDYTVEILDNSGKRFTIYHSAKKNKDNITAADMWERAKYNNVTTPLNSVGSDMVGLLEILELLGLQFGLDKIKAMPLITRYPTGERSVEDKSLTGGRGLESLIRNMSLAKYNSKYSTKLGRKRVGGAPLDDLDIYKLYPKTAQYYKLLKNIEESLEIKKQKLNPSYEIDIYKKLKEMNEAEKQLDLELQLLARYYDFVRSTNFEAVSGATKEFLEEKVREYEKMKREGDNNDISILDLIKKALLKILSFK